MLTGLELISEVRHGHAKRLRIVVGAVARALLRAKRAGEVVIGKGKPLFQPSETRITLRLAEARTFGNGVVLLRYARR